MNVATLIAAAAFGLTALYQFQLGPDWRYLAFANLALGLAVLPTLALDRIGLEAKVAYITLWLFVFLAHDLSGGKNGDDHLLLLVCPPMMFYFLGSKYWRCIAAVTVVSTVSMIWVSLYVPLVMPPEETLASRLLAPFRESIVLKPEDVLFMVLICAISAALYFTAFSANAAVEDYEGYLEREVELSDRLLSTLLPPRMIKRVKSDPGSLIADEYDAASILFADLSEFTIFVARNGAKATVTLLDRLFSEFDKLVVHYGVEKIKTIGDSYMVVAGLDDASIAGKSPSDRMAALALDMISTVHKLSNDLDPKISVRIGIHRGPVIAGVIGGDRPFFDVWGDTVNVAAHLESSGEPGRTQITTEFANDLAPQFVCEQRGQVEIKGKGAIMTYWLVEDRAASNV